MIQPCELHNCIIFRRFAFFSKPLYSFDYLPKYTSCDKRICFTFCYLNVLFRQRGLFLSVSELLNVDSALHLESFENRWLVELLT